MPVQHRDIDGVRLAVDRVGQGRPVVCLSSICHDARDFDALADRLGDRFELIRIEWPGHGRSGPDTRPASAERYAELVAAALDQLGLERPLLIGNSIGGAAAILIATARPVAGVVLCDSGGFVRVDATVRRICSIMARFFAAGEARTWWFGPAFALYYRLVLPSPSARAQRARIIAGAYDTARLAREAWLSFARPEADIRARAAALAVPVWVAWGRRDWVTPLSLCRAGIEAIPGVELTMFEGGHSPFLEQPDAFAPAFSAFADRTSP
jgi:pimeloyl-ACP methyl ester carboxylesterase